MRKTFIAIAVLALAAAAEAQTTVVCESNGRYRQCEIDGPGRVSLTRQLSRVVCVEGESWGYRDGMVWVDKGCRAEFTLTQRGFSDRRGGRTLTCESEGGRKVCRTDTRGGVSVARQISKSSCIQGRSWGYDRDSIWVDEGCRAEFVIGAGNREPGRIQERLDQLVVCESEDGRRRYCPANTAFGIQLVRQISQSSCDFGRDWGYDRNGVWVTNGCRAEFAFANNDPRQRIGDGRSDVIRCESRDGRRTRCSANTARGVDLVEQLSDAECLFNKTWGFDRNGIWVSGGCRADFRLRSARR